ncbi:hypothetical protein DFH06DRAFT_1426838 [Mycena polygramma]|nr:hypothetical protein DFH06DRAFT_1426838 [Mycena polygramma]
MSSTLSSPARQRLHGLVSVVSDVQRLQSWYSWLSSPTCGYASQWRVGLGTRNHNTISISSLSVAKLRQTLPSPDVQQRRAALSAPQRHRTPDVPPTLRLRPPAHPDPRSTASLAPCCFAPESAFFWPAPLILMTREQSSATAHVHVPAALAHDPRETQIIHLVVLAVRSQKSAWRQETTCKIHTRSASLTLSTPQDPPTPFDPDPPLAPRLLVRPARRPSARLHKMSISPTAPGFRIRLDCYSAPRGAHAHSAILLPATCAGQWTVDARIRRDRGLSTLLLFGWRIRKRSQRGAALRLLSRPCVPSPMSDHPLSPTAHGAGLSICLNINMHTPPSPSAAPPTPTSTSLTVRRAPRSIATHTVLPFRTLRIRIHPSARLSSAQDPDHIPYVPGIVASASALSHNGGKCRNTQCAERSTSTSLSPARRSASGWRRVSCLGSAAAPARTTSRVDARPGARSHEVVCGRWGGNGAGMALRAPHLEARLSRRGLVERLGMGRCEKDAGRGAWTSQLCPPRCRALHLHSYLNVGRPRRGTGGAEGWVHAGNGPRTPAAQQARRALRGAGGEEGMWGMVGAGQGRA